MQRLALLPFLALMLLPVAPGPRTAAAAPGPLQVRVNLAPAEPRCDGDSVRVRVAVTHADGTPAPGAQVDITMPDGASTATIGRTTGATVSGQTDRSGVLRARMTPAPGTKTSFLFVIGVVGGPSPHPAVGACPFSADRAFVLNGTAWHDANADGARSPDERPLAGQLMEIYGMCYGPGCFVPLHSVRTGSRGQFQWTGLSQSTSSDLGPLPSWRLCVPDGPGARNIVSLNGAPIAPGSVEHVVAIAGQPVRPSQCVAISALHAGVNDVSVGLR
ncbi:MAG TPA: hypothetical protein VEZ14_10095 [Dehalococcoidia bacterium]|nr:hypothetical protein [Dehalococcoidia bacterium]